MEHRRRNPKEGPLEAGDLVDHDALRILPAEEPLRLIGEMPGKKGEGQDRDQPDRPRQGRKEQIERDADQGSRRPRRQRCMPAPETGGQEFDPSFVQGTPRRLLKSARLRRSLPPASSGQAIHLHGELVEPSEALHPDIFEQPFFSPLAKWNRREIPHTGGKLTPFPPCCQ